MISALFEKTESIRLLEALCKHTNFFSILKGAICEERKQSKRILSIFWKVNSLSVYFPKDRERVCSSHGSVGITVCESNFLFNDICNFYRFR